MKGKFWIFGVLWTAGLVGAFLGGKSSRPHTVAGAGDEVADRHSSKSSVVVSPSATLGIDDPQASAETFCRALLRLETSDDFQEHFDELLADRESMRHHDALFMMGDAWAAKHPKEAADRLNALSFDDARNPYLFSALSQWSSKDPQAALDWLKLHHSEAGPTRDYLMASTVRGAAASDPDLALQTLLNATASPERLGALEFLTRAWLDEGLKSATEKLAGVPASESRLRERAIQQLIEHSDAGDFDSVKSWAGGISESSEARIAVAAVAARWSRSDPEAAASWVGGLAEPESRALAYGEIGTRWARIEPLDAGAWIAGHEGQAEYDLAIRAVAWSTVGMDPQAAFSQVAKMSNEALRNETFEQVGRVWMSSQPRQARPYFLAESPIPPELRSRLLESFE